MGPRAAAAVKLPAIGKTIGGDVENTHHQGARCRNASERRGPGGYRFNLIAPFFRQRRYRQGCDFTAIFHKPRQRKGQIATLQGQRLTFTNRPKRGWA